MKKLLSFVLVFIFVLSGNCVLAGAEEVPIALTLSKEEPLAVKGIDVSYWQGTEINWKKVKEAGYSFAILRVGYSGKKDTTFEINYANAKAAGVNLGCYMYSYATTVEKAKSDANEVLEWIAGKKFEYPIYYDIEDPSQSSLTKVQRTEIALTFVRMLKEKGYYTGVYTYKYLFENGLDYDAISKECETWIAHFPDDALDYSDKYGMWQYTEEGRVSGVYGNVDIDICYRDYPSIIKKNGYNGYEGIIYLEPTGVKGDVNGDLKCTLLDVVTLAHYVAGWKGLEVVEQELDTDGDTLVTLKDVVYLAQTVAGWYD